MTTVKLFCFSYAGGSASMYVKWKQKLPGQIKVVPVELAGRGARCGEPFYDTFYDLIDDVYPFVKCRIQQNEPFAFFGFSMGSLVAYEVYCKLLKEGLPLPHHLFMVGREAPNTDIFKVNHLNNLDFIEEIFSYDGMPVELYNDKEVLSYFLPILRADFRIHETYTYAGELQKINCNCTIWYGKDDKSVIHENILKWKIFAGAEMEIIILDGGHFFLAQHEPYVLNKISEILLAQLIPV